MCTLDSHLECSLSALAAARQDVFTFLVQFTSEKGSVYMSACELCLLKYLIDDVEAVHLVPMTILLLRPTGNGF